MKRIVLDHFRRRVWVFAVGVIVQLILGWSLAFFATREQENPLAVIQAQIGLFMGAVLLTADLHRGIARTLATLPLTPHEIGRAWWMATVAIPATVLSALLVIGALAHHVVYPDTAIPWDKLAGSVLTLLLILGAAFTIVLRLPTHPGEARGWQRLVNLATGAAYALLFCGGLWFFQNLADNPYRLVPLLTLGVALTIVGWFRADHLMLGRATARPISHTDFDATRLPAPARHASGLGGLPLLLRDAFVRVLLYSLAMFAAIILIAILQSHLKSWPDVARTVLRTGYFPVWFIAFLFLAPTFQQLRLLRSLPLSTNGLAATLLALILLPLLALGVLTTMFCASALGPTEARLAAMGCLLTLPPAGWMVAAITWQGLRTSTRVLLFLLMMGGQVALAGLQTHGRGGETGLSLALVAVLSVGGVAFAFFLTRLAVQRGTLAYRTPAVGGFTPGWAAGR